MFSDKCLQLPRETGSCYDYVMQYSYVSSSGQCEAFYYGGCEGNDNRFDSSEECEAACVRTTPAPTVEPPGLSAVVNAAFNDPACCVLWQDFTCGHFTCPIAAL